ncbi:metallophosphoesterase family protein [Pseudonocardia halophobica]|uniref:metallophosphoesterase family protein n=1 Tax=Pseudonocardia halophobica TaxID=29401 RepID=UPI003D8BEF8D
MHDPSRLDEANTGYGCEHPGTGIAAVPGGARLSWLRPAPLWRSRNDRLVRLLGDPTDDMRREWLRRLDAGRGPDPTRLVDRFAGRDSIAATLLGDPGEGDASQYCVVPVLQRVAGDTDLAVVVSDVIYPAGGLHEYAAKLARPYADYPGPIYGLPGNHDWYDGLTGFMSWFCGTPPEEAAPADPGTGWTAFLRRLLWRRGPRGRTADLEAARVWRPAEEQHALQPGPYCAIDAGPVRLVLIDTGIRGALDREQGEWLRDTLFAADRPAIVLTGKPLITYAEHHPCPIEGGGTVAELVRDPRASVVAVIGGDDHNYQRYPVRLADGREILHLVAGGSGAYLSATHPVPNVDVLAPECTEEDFRCYPLRGDSLAHFSRRYDALRRFGTGTAVVSPSDATTIMAERIGIAPPRTGTPPAEISPRARQAAERVLGGPKGRSENWTSVLYDTDRPPMLKSFLRLDATAAEIRIDCWAATGCLEHERDPVLEDRIVARPGADGRWTWASATPGRERP